MARVFTSSVIGAPPDQVWKRIRDFNGLPTWHPAIRESQIEGGEPSDKIGCVRDFYLQNGDRIRERLPPGREPFCIGMCGLAPRCPARHHVSGGIQAIGQ